VVPADTENFQVDFGCFSEMLTDQVAAVLINTPNNPSGIVYTRETLEKLADISKIRINRELPLDERKKQYIRKTGNPYMVCVGGMKVKVQFTEGGISFDEAFENLLLSV